MDIKDVKTKADLEQYKIQSEIRIKRLKRNLWIEFIVAALFPVTVLVLVVLLGFGKIHANNFLYVFIWFSWVPMGLFVAHLDRGLKKAKQTLLDNGVDKNIVDSL